MQQLQQKLECVQNSCLRFVLNTPPSISGKEMRQKLKMCNLSQRRRNNRLYMVHRCVLKQCPEKLPHWFMSNKDAGRRETRSADKLQLIYPNNYCDYLRNSFTYRGAQDWNALPEALHKLDSLVYFRKAIKLYFNPH